ncbi:MAG: stem cell self-renewal protein Piwi, partial [Symploca sp. SIO2G7]|nr:stem cell self-renewal protein Piwi [Symploca sp. SIO2G7]
MTTTPGSPIYLSEIFPLTISQPNLMGFRLTPEVEREVGNRLSFYFCRKFPELVVTWHEQLFWVLGTPTRQMPSPSEWKNTLKNIQQEVEDFSHCYWSFQWVRQPAPTPEVLAQLAFQISRTDRPFSASAILSDQSVEVKREPKFWAETIELDGKLQSAFTLTINSSILFTGTLSDFYQHHPFRQDPKTVLIGLKVQDIESGSSATIVQIAGTVGEHRQDLIKQATGSISKEALKPENAPDDQPLVAVQFGKNRKQFHYAMAALRPRITASTAERFGVDYGKLLKKTKISYPERQKLLDEHKRKAAAVLATYGFKVADRCINSLEHHNLFWQPQTPLEKTELLFGKGVKSIQSKIIAGLKRGGVYRR